MIRPARYPLPAAGRQLIRWWVTLALGFAGLVGRSAPLPAGLETQPLVAPAPRTGPTLFTSLSPQDTGLVTENRYADPKMWADLYQEFTLGAIGTGVAVGDYDGDGRPDIFVATKTEGCRLLRNLGGWKFEDVTARAGVGATPGVWNQGVTFTDVNNDGRLDLYVCRFNAPNLLYVNQGNGTFKDEAAERGLAVVDACGMAAFCDFNRDGWLDVYIQTNLLDAKQHPNGQRDRLFVNDHGKFTQVTVKPGEAGGLGHSLARETQGHSATWWDYNNDGWPDLYVANDFAEPDMLHLNQSEDLESTNMLDQVLPHTPFSAMGADLGDVNNDGLIDLLVGDMAATTHEKDQRGMADSRARRKDDPPGSTVAPQLPHNALYLNTGTGRMLEAAELAGLAATDWTWSLRLEDLDNDGRLDLHVTNGMVRELHNSDLLSRMMYAESATERIRIMKSSPVLAEANLAYRNLGDLKFENVSAAWGLDQKGVSFGAAFGDFDGDGDLDLVFTNYQGGITVLRNDSDTGHRLTVALHGAVSNRLGVGATVRIETATGVQVRQLVLARGYLSSSEPILHFGLGDERTIRRLTVSWPSGHTQVFENIAANQRLTITEPSTPAPEKSKPAEPAKQFVEVGQVMGFAFAQREDEVDETATQRLLPMRHNRAGPALAVGDLDGDGRDDVIVGGTTRDPLRTLLGNSAGAFASAPASVINSPASVNDGPMLVFDADGDGRNDLLVTRGGASLLAGAPEYQPQLFLNDGRGSFRLAPAGALPSLAISVGAAATADFNGDGRLDVFVGGRLLPGDFPFAPQSALLANRGDKFEDVTDSLAPALRNIGMVTSALWSDVDGDGWIDLLLTLDWGGVRYFNNNQGRAFEDRSEAAGFASATAGWWTSIATADFNGDGRPDYVVGNAGLNTRYRADATHPALLFAGDFKGDGSNQLVEGYYEGDKLYPWLSRRELSAAIPTIGKRFPKNDGYARATLGEILGEDKLAKAERFAATELRSGVLLSGLDGKYHFEPLPRLAQIAPAQGIVAGDFDGDGKADIYVVQNSFAPVPSIGRFDGGLSLLLRSDGRGHFTPVPPAESGLVVPGDAKALAVLDLNGDGWPDFLVTRNNSTALAFRNQPVAGRHMFVVRLQGRAGNPTAIGARVILALSDGTQQSAEVTAGSGYLSQSSAGCFFGYTDAVTPRNIQVRWPTGETTEHPVPASPGNITLRLPDR